MRMAPLSALVTGALLLNGCANARFQTAAGRFGTETAESMAAQSDQIEAVSALEEQRLRDNIASARTRLSLDDNCFETLAGPDGKFPTCGLVEATETEANPIKFQYVLPDILALQDALGAYGDNLARLADDAEEDQAAFSASVDKLGASIGKLDAAISKAAKMPRIDPEGKIGTIASVIGALGNLAFKYQRRHALRRIIVANDPLIQEALMVLRDADQRATEYKRTAALDQARAATTKAALGGTDDERRKLNADVYRAVDLVNSIEGNAPKLERLAAIHGALATLARSNNEGARAALARKMLTDWTRD